MHTNNKWKKYFLYLLFLNLLIVVTVFGLLFWPVSEDRIDDRQKEIEGEHSEFIVRTTKANLNDLVNTYIDQLLEGTKHHYRVSFDEDVHLLGDLPIFSSTVPLSIHLEPFVQDNGNIVLKQRSISIGKLKLPNKKIMEYMKRYLTMPSWVQVDPENEEVYVAISEMETKSKFQVHVEEFDLRGNDLAFKIYVPYQTLGIENLKANSRQ